MSNIPILKTVTQFSKENPAFPESGLRWLIFNERKNGLKESGAIIRLGRKVMIDTDRFFEWLYAKNNQQSL